MNDALKLVNLTKIFSNNSIKSINRQQNKIIAVNNLNLTIPHGSVYGFLGRNGAGKTTTLKMITGLSKPTDGEIYIYGNKVKFGKPASYKNIGFLPDVPEFYSFMTAREYLFLCGRLHKMSDDAIKNKIREIFELINFDKKRLKNKISTFSRGMKQKLGIAVALINSPDLIMLDEPTSALDPIGRKETINIINNLKGKYTVVFSTHILTDIERVCDRIALIEKGSLILDGSISDIKSQYANLTETLYIDVLNDNKLNCERFFSILQNINFINQAEIKEEENIIKIKLKTSDRKRAGEILPRIIYENNLSLIKFEFEDANLEEIFISATSSQVSQEKEKKEASL